MATPGQRRRALLTGLTGQDGSFLAELLLEDGYDVVGIVRAADKPLGPSEHLRDRVELVPGDLLQPDSLVAAVRSTNPDELYHLAAPSFVPDSWRRPAETIAAIAVATAALLEAVRDHAPDARVFSAATGHIFGDAPESPQNEDTPCRPGDPYSLAKLAAHLLVGRLRERDGVHACSGILYNHESERRPEQFVSRKIARGAAAVKLGLAHEVVLGDLDAVRDWSFAGDIIHGAQLMLQQEEPNDYVLASGTPHTVGEMAEIAFAHVGLDAHEHIRVDPEFVRAPEPTPLVGDPSRAHEQLGWRPQLSFQKLIERMVEADLRDLQSSA